MAVVVYGSHPPPVVPAYGPPPPPAYCDPKAPPPCALHTNLPFCLIDPEYPEFEVATKISHDPIFLKKYSDVADQVIKFSNRRVSFFLEMKRN